MRWVNYRVAKGLLYGGVLVPFAFACLPDDLGNPCPMDDLGATGEAEVTGIFPEVVEVKTTFPCDAMTCVSTEQATAHCSRECRNDAGCGQAFECRQIGQFGPFSSSKFCAWRGCTVSTECGDVTIYKCLVSPITGEGRCGFVYGECRDAAECGDPSVYRCDVDAATAEGSCERSCDVASDCGDEGVWECVRASETSEGRCVSVS